MTSEIRANTLKNRVGLGTVDVTNTGAILSGIVTATNVSVASSVTATTFYGSAANLTNIPVQVEFTNNADNRVITGGSGNNLNGEATLTYGGTELLISNASPSVKLNDTDNSGVVDINNVGGAAVIQSTGDTLFETNGTERFRIDSSGRVLIGTTSGSDALVVDGGSDAGTILTNSTNSNGNMMTFQCSGTSKFFIGSAGSFITGNTGTTNQGIRAEGDLLFATGGHSEKLRITSAGTLTQTSTTAFQIAKGTTAQRPSAVTGMIRYNTTTDKLEYYDGSSWQSIRTTFDGAGGNSTYNFGGYKVHVFTSNGNFTVTGAGSVDALIVAGGGGAGQSDRTQYNGAWNGGGGAGGVLWQQGISVSSGTTYSIVIGNGGAVQNNGQNSTAFGYTAIGGGRGGGTTSAGSGNVNWNGASGGSGGGGLGDRVGPMLGGSGTSGQGNNGANGTDPGGNPNYEQGGGGGGAGEAGNTDGIGFGGDGRDMSGEFGTSVGENGYFGGGGAGGQGTDNSNTVNEGGLGGGGNSGYGYQNNGQASEAGAANTGGGGGAGGNSNNAGGQAGGSGVVLVRYAL